MLPMVANSVAICKNIRGALRASHTGGYVNAAANFAGLSSVPIEALPRRSSAKHPTAKMIVFISADEVLGHRPNTLFRTHRADISRFLLIVGCQALRSFAKFQLIAHLLHRCRKSLNLFL
jgi:hypothetical protein